MRLKLTLEYDGTGFRGWAAQPGLRTVEGVVREALDDVFATWGELAVAGRTDTGVHALAQVASVEAEGGPPPERAAEALNAELPDDVTTRPRPLPPTFTLAGGRAQGATAIASTGAARRRRSRRTAAGGIRGRSKRSGSPNRRIFC